MVQGPSLYPVMYVTTSFQLLVYQGLCTGIGSVCVQEEQVVKLAT